MRGLLRLLPVLLPMLLPLLLGTGSGRRCRRALVRSNGTAEGIDGFLAVLKLTVRTETTGPCKVKPAQLRGFLRRSVLSLAALVVLVTLALAFAFAASLLPGVVGGLGPSILALALVFTFSLPLLWPRRRASLIRRSSWSKVQPALSHLPLSRKSQQIFLRCSGITAPMTPPCC